MKVETVHDWSEGEEWEQRERVTRYDDVRCPECNRMLYCVLWEDIGYPDVHCPVCGFRESHPWDDHPEIREAWERLNGR